MTEPSRNTAEDAMRRAGLNPAAWAAFTAELPGAVEAARAMATGFQRHWPGVPPESALQLSDALKGRSA